MPKSYNSIRYIVLDLILGFADQNVFLFYILLLNLYFKCLIKNIIVATNTKCTFNFLVNWYRDWYFGNQQILLAS